MGFASGWSPCRLDRFNFRLRYSRARGDDLFVRSHGSRARIDHFCFRSHGLSAPLDHNKWCFFLLCMFSQKIKTMCSLITFCSNEKQRCFRYRSKAMREIKYVVSVKLQQQTKRDDCRCHFPTTKKRRGDLAPRLS